MRFSCPHCGKVLNVKDKFAGKKAKCPGCKKVFQVPAGGAGPSAAAGRASAAPAVRQAHDGGVLSPSKGAPGGCPNCDEPLPRGAVLCVSCGYDTRTGRVLKTDFGE